MRPFFSVILLTYNRRDLLLRAIESLQRQSFTDWEAIVIDDGSTDGTQEAIAPLLSSDPRFQYHRQTNQGPGLARNAGIAMSRGEFITFLDSDDEYLPEHLASRYALIRRDPSLEFLYGGVEVIGDPYVADREDPSRMIHIDQCFPGGTFVISRRLLERIGGFADVPYGDDTEFAERAIAALANVVKCDLRTYRYYRTSADSLCAIAAHAGIEGIRRFRGITD